MTETLAPPIAPTIAPRFELEERGVARLEAEDLPDLIEAPTLPPSAALLAASGVGVLALGLAALGTGNFVADQFARGPVLGWMTLAVAAGGFGLIGAGLLRELRGLFAVRAVDRLRADLADPERRARAARHWLRLLPDGAALLPAVEASDPQAVLALLRAGPAATLRARSQALGRAAAAQVFAASAAMPSPALDGLLVAWRGVRLVRQVAELHGMRPGLVGTLSLLRRTAASAAFVLASDVALDTVLRGALSNKLLAHVVGDVAGAGVAARRMVVLARATHAACCPVIDVR